MGAIRLKIPSARAFAGLALVLVLLFAFPGSEASPSPGDRPFWMEGQRWVYEGHFRASGGRVDATVTVAIAKMDTGSALVRSIHRFGNGWLVTESLVSVPSFAIVVSDFAASNGVELRTRYDPPLQLFAFPLEAGKRWLSTPTFAGYAYPFAYRVRPMVSVTTPAGTFDAFPIESNTMGHPFIQVTTLIPGFGSAVTYYAREVGNLVRYVAYDGDGRVVARFSLTAPSQSSLRESEARTGALLLAPLLGSLAIAGYAGLRVAARRTVTRTAGPSSPGRRRPPRGRPRA